MKNLLLSLLLLLVGFVSLKAQPLSRFDFDDPAQDERIATIGPNAISSGAIANARATGNGTPQGCAAGVTPFGTIPCFTAVGCAQAINLIVPNTANLFNVPNPIMGIDYRRPVREIDGWFWLKDQLAFGIRFSKITARYAYDNGLGGCVPQIEFASYPPAWDWSSNGSWVWGGAVPSNGEIPVDGIWRTYGFSYDPITGIAAITTSNPAHTELSFGVAGMNFCGWTPANMAMFNNLDNGATGFNTTSATLDNAEYGRIIILPVVLDYLKAEQKGLGVDINWKTSDEQENMGFLLYRSTDADHWVEMGRVNGNADTEAKGTYHFRDETPYRGLNFYRLVQVDMNGATTGFPSVKVMMDYAGTELLSMYPNPVSEGVLNFKFDSPSDQGLNLQIVDLSGQVVAKHEYALRSGINQLAVDVTTLAPGMYIAQVTSSGHTHVQKFTVAQ